jgi:hypothetical protein
MHIKMETTKELRELIRWRVEIAGGERTEVAVFVLGQHYFQVIE